MLDPEPMDREFSFYLLPGFSLQSFSSAVEALTLANEVLGRQAYRWNVVSDDGHPVVSSSGMSVLAGSSLTRERQTLRNQLSTKTIVTIGERTLPGVNKQLDAWLRECQLRRSKFVGILGGTIVLAHAGLLDGRRCSIHWEQFPFVRERYRHVTAKQTAFESNGGIYTCAGGSAPFDMFLEMIARDQDPDTVARICEKAIILNTRVAGERQRLPFHSWARPSHAAVVKIVEMMEATIVEPMPIDEMARSVSLSRRQVERLFLKEMGCSPSKYYLRLRLEQAQLLLVSTHMLVVEIAVACGFSSASHFSKSYRDRYACSPHESRSSRALARKTVGYDQRKVA